MVLERAGVPLDPRAPYAAPESGTAPSSSTLDRFAFAAIVHEWLFGRPSGSASDTPVTVPPLPDVDGDRLSDAFTTALAPVAADRFATCAAFVAAIRESTRAGSRAGPA